MPELDAAAIDFAAASESFAPVRRLRRADLETLRLVVTHQGRTVPTGITTLYEDPCACSVRSREDAVATAGPS